MTVYINKKLSSRLQCLLYDVVLKLYTIIIHTDHQKYCNFPNFQHHTCKKRKIVDCCYPSQVILTAITEHSWCLKLFLQLVNRFLFDFPCIRGFHDQEWCVLFKSIITSSLFGFLIPKKLLMSVFDKPPVLYLKASVDSF